MLMIRRTTTPVVFIAALTVLAAATAWAWDGPAASPEKEQELLAVLRSDAPASEKAITCKSLAIYGSEAAVPDLAKLLADEQLHSWSRIALEAIPGAAADEALLAATETLQGKLLVGTVNSIGVRRNTKAAEKLATLLKNENADVASAAAVALGRIGNEGATKALRAALAGADAKVLSAVAEGCILCAERLAADGKSDDAAAIYDEVRKAEVPKQRILEATRGAILTRKAEGLALLVEQINAKDKAFFNIGLSTAREFPGSEIDKALATQLEALPPERGALLISALADRPKTVVLSVIVHAASKGSEPVRLAAVKALSQVGDASCLSVLLEIALGDNADLASAAKTTLADLPGEKINAEIAKSLAKAEGKSYPLLIELVGQRRIEATAALLKAVDSSDKVVRGAALAALGETVALKDLSVLVSQAVSPKHKDDAEAAQKALKAAAIRMPDREACAAELAKAMEDSPAAMKVTLLEILGDVGGTKALQAIGAASKGKDAQLQDAGSRVLGKWNSVEAAPVLLDLAKTGPAAQYRIRALRGYIGLARKFAMPDQQRAEMCQSALDLSKQPAEQKLVLDVMKLHPSLETLKLAIKTMQVADLKEDATQATLVIAQKLGAKGVDVKDLLNKAGLDKVKLEIIKAEYGSGTTQKDVTAVLQKQAGDLPLITLAAASYNTSFGGDPLPNSVKLLKIQYKINGKAGEASFAEDALIILPMPK